MVDGALSPAFPSSKLGISARFLNAGRIPFSSCQGSFSRERLSLARGGNGRFFLSSPLALARRFPGLGLTPDPFRAGRFSCQGCRPLVSLLLFFPGEISELGTPVHFFLPLFLNFRPYPSASSSIYPPAFGFSLPSEDLLVPQYVPLYSTKKRVLLFSGDRFLSPSFFPPGGQAPPSLGSSVLSSTAGYPKFFRLR